MPSMRRDPLCGCAASPAGDDALAARRLLLGVSLMELSQFGALCAMESL